MKLRRFYICMLVLFWVANMAAQNRRTVGDQEWLDISARIFGSDEMEEKPYPLPNANVTIQCLNDTLAGRKSTATNREGKFDLELNVLKKRIKKKESARIRLQVSYVGYETIDSVFTMKQIYYDSSHKSYGYFWELEIDSLIMRSKPMSSEEVLIVDELKRMYESGDTTVFNVDAFMMPRGTVLLNLVRRLPGLRYDDGVLTYRDSVISEIRLNGESFFASDMRIALENIENSDLKQFKVYKALVDTLSQDSAKHWVADMITKKPVNKVEIAKPEVGTSTKRNTYRLRMENVRWNSGGKGEWSTSVQLDDLPQTTSWKMSSNDVTGTFSKSSGKVNMNGHANYNYNDMRRKTESFGATVMPEYEQYSRSASGSNSYNGSYAQNLSAAGRVGKRDSWSANMNYNTANNHSNDWSESSTYKANPLTADGTELLSESELRTIGLTNVTNDRHQRHHTDNLSFGGNYRKSFKGDFQPSLSVNVNFGHDHSYSTNYEKRRNEYLQFADSVWSYERYSTSPNSADRFSLSSNFSMYYSCKNSDASHSIQFGYNLTSNHTKGGTDVYDAANAMAYIDSLSTRNRSSLIEHAMSANYNLHYNSLSVGINMRVVPTERSYRNELMDGFVADTTIHGIRFSPSVNVNYQLGSNKRLFIAYSVSNQLTDPSRLVRSSTNYNPLSVRLSNPDLKQTISHSIDLNMNMTNAISMGCYINWQRNGITQRTIYDPTTGGTITMPVNINGEWSMSSNASYRTDFKHANLSINVSHNYNHGVSYQRTTNTNEDIIGYNDDHSINLTPRFVVYGKKYDMSIDGLYGYQWNKSSYATERDRIHRYNLRTKVNYWPTDRLTLTTDLEVNGRAGYRTADANRADIIWNMHAQYKFLRNYRATLKVSWYDILRNQRTYTSSISGSQWSETRSSGNPHYALITFQYKLYKMK